MDRGAITMWRGVGPDGVGEVTTDSGALHHVRYSAGSRFEQRERTEGTNAEELLAAAEASCFTMTLAERLAEAGHPALAIRTEARVQLIKPSGRWQIPAIRLHCTATVPGIDEHEFLAIAHAAKTDGPIAQATRADVTLTISLEQPHL